MYVCMYLYLYNIIVLLCVCDKVPQESIGHMSAQMSSLFNKAGDLNCHYCQHLTLVHPARWFFCNTSQK